MAIVPPRGELSARVNRLRQLMHARKVGALLVTNEQNVRYLSGFTGNDSALLVTRSRKILLTDFRYLEEAYKTAPGWSVIIEKSKRVNDKIVWTIPQGLFEKAGHIAHSLGLRTVAVEPENIRIGEMKALRKSAKRVKFKPEAGLVGELRLCKSDWEVQQIEHALRIQESCFLELCREFKNGITEREAAARLRYLMCKAGAEDEAFHSMFQIGPNSSLPHGRPTPKALKGNAIILMDWGAKRGGYHSDLTRTFFLGTIPPKLRKIHQIVMRAQLNAIEKIAPDADVADVDSAARDYIDKAGYGKAFGHSTGHGLGLDIHEAPSLSQRYKGNKLRVGMVITVEPGIYIPGLGGVRIEDDVLVTPTGHRVLSRLGKGLRWNGTND